jgi:hypothetical protein
MIVSCVGRPTFTPRLLQWKREILVFLTLDDDVELPLHEIGGQPLALCEPRAVECGELLKTPSRQHSPPISPLAGCGRQLTLERVLDRPPEIARGGRLIGAHSHPLGGERVEELVDSLLLRSRIAGRQRGHGQAR